MNTLIGAVAASFATLTLAGTASAATVNLYRSSGYVESPTLSGTFDGVGVTLTAATWTLDSFNSTTDTGTGTIDPLGPSDQAEFSYSTGGLGIINSSGDNSHEIEGNGWKDIAIFEFDHKVTLDWMKFNYVDSNDDVAVFVGDSLAGLTDFSLYNILGSAPTGEARVDLDLMGQVFAFGAKHTFDNFKLKQFSFSKVTDPVPLPGGLALMATAVAAAGFVRSRKPVRA